ncbi:hypothetical protein CPB83DRAFT_71000 [Crepidotus variabilis]|uniref:Uncharacterized protein n=1 Tax=Crepidotus variabilis TaxID=179855 RepID=A0A9P6E5J0_9AGAR|nr:hypothetical protein CPB83DRAFT_71000 [Crepidotus variabilis]
MQRSKTLTTNYQKECPIAIKRLIAGESRLASLAFTLCICGGLLDRGVSTMFSVPPLHNHSLESRLGPGCRKNTRSSQVDRSRKNRPRNWGVEGYT